LYEASHSLLASWNTTPQRYSNVDARPEVKNETPCTVKSAR
jgi:hypothetical protein